MSLVLLSALTAGDLIDVLVEFVEVVALLLDLLLERQQLLLLLLANIEVLCGLLPLGKAIALGLSTGTRVSTAGGPFAATHETSGHDGAQAEAAEGADGVGAQHSCGYEWGIADGLVTLSG